MAGRGITVEEVLSLATQQLRCIDWTNISEELMTGAICSSDAPDISTLYSLSRPVREDEVIDYFLSHSWHDDVQVKWRKLQQVASEFEARQGRCPTFWLDKVCINQSCIADGLKVLPVNVMACRQVLVLCGSTYPDRLWCIWEMCVVFSFACPEQALERLRFELLSQGSSSDVMQRLLHFESKNARCYDPNEQRKLLQVIETIGADRFDGQIRRLTEAIQHKARRKLRAPSRSYSRLSTFVTSISPQATSVTPEASAIGAYEETTSEASLVSI
eukprot:TRINITY_DN113966_c0_g1_i1.p1 TRINITY_DN113966_c0_g1~~TRINITY_DN113966_c0_g1_i1.p1  ORF type:complete len:273 (+),score=27.43 TRINITY_DN113966_c0_g1_i1:2-820(+)